MRSRQPQLCATAHWVLSAPPASVRRSCFPFSAPQDTAELPGKAESGPKINCIEHGKNPGRTQLTPLPQAARSRTNNAHSCRSSSFCIQQICHRNPTTCPRPDKPFSWDNAEFTGNSWATSSSRWCASRLNPHTGHLQVTRVDLQKRFGGIDRQTGVQNRSSTPTSGTTTAPFNKLK